MYSIRAALAALVLVGCVLSASAAIELTQRAELHGSMQKTPDVTAVVGAEYSPLSARRRLQSMSAPGSGSKGNLNCKKRLLRDGSEDPESAERRRRLRCGGGGGGGGGGTITKKPTKAPSESAPRARAPALQSPPGRGPLQMPQACRNRSTVAVSLACVWRALRDRSSARMLRVAVYIWSLAVKKC